tara:strand:- start:1465 stop:2766 length:1302 start_codon:yes stop_codon:yes gene_type:complete
MGGGLLQLIYVGKEDLYLTGNPQMTYFKQVYRRYTNFSIECIEQSFNKNPTVNESNVFSLISKSGDLLKGLHLDLLFSEEDSGLSNGSYVNWTNNTGHAFIKRADFEIGSNIIDTHYGHWMDVWNELTDHNENEFSILNKHPRKDNSAYLQSNAATSLPELQMYIPFKFWFTRNPGAALPLLALKYTEVKLKLQTRSLKALINSDHGTGTIDYSTAPTCKLFGDYIFLDKQERRRFTSNRHEYLIEQVQYNKLTAATSITLNFNHPVKELIWTVQNTTVTQEVTTSGDIDATQNVLIGADLALSNKNDYFCYDAKSDGGISERLFGGKSFEGFTTMKLTFEGIDRFSARKASYFGNFQPIESGHKNPNNFIYCYSFALRPEDYQPTGTCNFTKIRSAKMEFGSIQASSNINIYAINYNMLIIYGGTATLGYTR